MGVRKPWKGCTMAEMEIHNKYIRNWSEYNERLVRRGEKYIDLDFIENWDEELEQQNRGKKGRPYIYPEAFIRFSAVVHDVFRIPFRQMEGFYRRLGKYIDGLKAADYTTLFRRVRRLEGKAGVWKKMGRRRRFLFGQENLRRKRNGTWPELCNSGGEKEVSDVQYAAGYVKIPLTTISNRWKDWQNGVLHWRTRESAGVMQQSISDYNSGYYS